MVAHCLPETKIPAAPLPTASRMYAIIFDLDQETLKQTYGAPSYNNAYADIKKFLTNKGFEWQQGSAYFGKDIDAVKCVLAATLPNIPMVRSQCQRYPNAANRGKQRPQASDRLRSVEE